MENNLLLFLYNIKFWLNECIKRIIVCNHWKYLKLLSNTFPLWGKVFSQPGDTVSHTSKIIIVLVRDMFPKYLISIVMLIGLQGRRI